MIAIAAGFAGTFVVAFVIGVALTLGVQEITDRVHARMDRGQIRFMGLGVLPLPGEQGRVRDAMREADELVELLDEEPTS